MKIDELSALNRLMFGTNGHKFTRRKYIRLFKGWDSTTDLEKKKSVAAHLVLAEIKQYAHAFGISTTGLTKVSPQTNGFIE